MEEQVEGKKVKWLRVCLVWRLGTDGVTGPGYAKCAR